MYKALLFILINCSLYTASISFALEIQQPKYPLIRRSLPLRPAFYESIYL